MRRVSKANAGLEVVLVRIPEAPMLSVSEEQPAFHGEAARRNFRDRIGGVSSFGCCLDRTAHVGIKAADVAVVAFSHRAFHLIPQAQIQRQPLIHLPIVLKENSVI